MYIILMSQTVEVNNVRIPRPRLVATFYRILETLLTTALSRPGHLHPVLRVGDHQPARVPAGASVRESKVPRQVNTPATDHCNSTPCPQGDAGCQEGDGLSEEDGRHSVFVDNKGLFDQAEAGCSVPVQDDGDGASVEVPPPPLSAATVIISIMVMEVS